VRERERMSNNESVQERDCGDGLMRTVYLVRI